jgi:hypothetical protein
MARFESHITIDKRHEVQVAAMATTHDWKFSVITGCPLLGPGTYCYLTGYDTNQDKLRKRVEETAELLKAAGIEPLRLKIERITWDTKTGVDEEADAEKFSAAISKGVAFTQELLTAAGLDLEGERREK